MPPSIRRLAAAALTLATLAAANPAAATVLVFMNDTGLDPIADSGLNNSGDNYGDRVASNSQNDYEYGATGGFTPNVSIAYGTDPTGSAFHGHTSGFGDLTRVIAGNSTPFDNTSELTLTADLNFRVALMSFDAGAFGGMDRPANVTVLNESNAVLFSQLNADIKGDTGHTTFEFTPPLEGSAIKIRIEPLNVPAAGDEIIGLDNITFGQIAVPEPSAVTLALGALAVLAARRRRRHA
jgi:MYXO-CTERM domain-containing protein